MNLKKILLATIVTLFFSSFTFGQSQNVEVVQNASGQTLTVDGKPFMINGMNWGYVPIGTNYNYSLWKQSDDTIKAALDAEMSLLKNMGINAIRQYTGIPSKWITYIYNNYGIYTMLNHSFGRYGLTIDGAWVPVTDYRDKKTQQLLLAEVTEMTNEYKDTRGLLMFMLGNENNYGLFWAGSDTEDFPDEEDQKREVGEKRGRPMYKLMNDAIVKMKKIDGTHPMAICNGDLLFLDIIAEECEDIDVYATNMYRGKSFGDAFEVVKEKLNKPIMFSEFGSDAFNALTNQEDQKMQAFFMVENWKDIYANAAGMGKAGNSIGGFTFQWSDGWWKVGQTKDLDIHNNDATWSNGGYYLDTENGSNNMNEEWFGVCAKGKTNERGLYTLYPRAAYYALKDVHKLNPYGPGIDSEFLNNYFKNLNLMEYLLKARGDKAALGGGDSEKLRISNLSARFTTFNTGGTLITTPENQDPTSNATPNQLGFDHMQSYFVGIEGKPSANMRAKVDLNITGNVAQNPIDEIFYENRARPVIVEGANGEDVTLIDNNRLQVYKAEFEWNAKDFDLRGFYRTGHYHWGYEGDFFNLYPEANYGPNLDIYGGEILGAEIDGKGVFKGLKAAIGPQLWWGANPTMLFKYRKQLGKWDIAGIYHRDFDRSTEFDPITGARVIDPVQARSGIIPPWATERATLAIQREFGKFGVMIGGIWGGSPLNGLAYQDFTGESGNYTVFEDRINSGDNWGGKIKMTYEGGRFKWYGQASAMGLVANGGADQTQTFTGWRLKDSGSGNMTNVLSGFTYSVGDLQIAPNFMWQKPLVDAIPNDIDGPGRLRNVIDDPFAVRNGNREMTAGELLLTYDPTPGTWMYEWDNDRSEDAKFAMNLGFVYRHLPTNMDAHIGFLADRTFFAFPTAAPAEDLWEINSRVVSKLNPELGLIANMYYGNGQANGDSDRTITRYGGDVRAIYKKFMLQGHAKFNDWGPFDYHRDFNLTFPYQFMLDISTSLGKPDWFILPSTRIGLRGTFRGLNEFSPRFAPASIPAGTFPAINPGSAVGFPNGSEWEIRTYVHINIGN